MPYINYHYGTSGTLWEGRYKASLLHEEQYLLTCMRYIELNPVRADMVKHPREYRCSSYRANGEGREDPLLTAPPLYLALGKTASQRREAYRSLFKAHIDEDVTKEIRAAWQTGTPLGNDYFKVKVETKLKTKVGQSRRHELNCMTTVAALGYGDIPPAAFLKALDIIDTPAWLAFNIKEDFLHETDQSGFSRLIRRLMQQDYIQPQCYRRYRHRLSIAGEPLYYIAMIAKKRKPVTNSLVAEYA